MKRTVHFNMNTNLESGLPVTACQIHVDGWGVNTPYKGALSITDNIEDVTCRICNDRVDMYADIE